MVWEQPPRCSRIRAPLLNEPLHLLQVTYPLHIILRYELEKASGVGQAV